jgi:KUP system potassium uptake protein
MTGEHRFATSTSAPSDLSQQSSTLSSQAPRPVASARFWPLALGSVGVVYGDIGTSPLYAFREGLAQASPDGVTAAGAMGVTSLALWALILVVTIKYVFFLMRLDNKGEGGVLSLMALAERAHKLGRTKLIFGLGVAGAALFYGDAIITPAISVLSAVEGLKSVPSLEHLVTPTVIMAATLIILVGLFAVQSRGTEKVAKAFGPICVVWFAVIAVLGLIHLTGTPRILAAISPTYGAAFLIGHPAVSLFVLGSIFLTVTGAEALYADMGHFGRKPITAAWLWLVLPALTLNYLGQGAMALHAIDLAKGAKVENADWFFTMAPEILRAPVVILACMATIIASQAVITGAYSITSQAIQLGLLPRMVVRNTSAHEAGQIYIPAVNTLLALGVVMLVAIFKTSANLAHAYGLAVTGTMVVTTSLAFIVVRGLWKWPVWKAALLIAPMLAIDLVFLGANALKILSGGFVPLLLGMTLFGVMFTWTRGRKVMADKIARDSIALRDVVGMLDARPPKTVPGVAVFLTGDLEAAPMALMHNLKHNRVLHETNVILTVRTADTPTVEPAKRLQINRLSPGFWGVEATFGYMEQPDVPRALLACKKQGLKFDIMQTSFFLGRRSVVVSSQRVMPLWQDKLFLMLHRNSTDPGIFYRLPPGRVVEMGSQVSV